MDGNFESALAGVHFATQLVVAAFEYAKEKVLGQVLRLLLQVAAPAHVGVNGIPVLLAQTRQRIPAILAALVSGGDYQGPAGDGKLFMSGQRVRCHGAPFRSE